MTERVLALALDHLRLSLWALLLGSAISLPLGVYAARRPRLERMVLGAASVIQTIPGLALLAIMVPALAWLGASGLPVPSIGPLPAVLGLTLYSLLPILRNTVVGLRGVDPAAKRAALGVGMTTTQSLRLVELPLATPTIVAGLRTATVWTVGMATLATPIGARSLGDLIFAGLQLRDHGAVLAGCLGSAALALVLDATIRAIESGARRRRPRQWAPAAALLATACAWAVLSPLAALGADDAAARIGAKPFTEQHVLAALVAERVEAAGATTETVGSLGSTVAFDALVAGDLDLYVEYTGTVWTASMHRDAVPADRERLYREVRDWLAAEHGVVIVARLGFENAYALATRSASNGGPGAATIGELAPLAPRLAVGGDYELFERGEWRSLESTYGLAFREQRAMDPTLLYDAVARGDVDVIGAYTTDGRVAAFDLVVLEDERGAIPPYDAILIANGDFAAREPAVIDALRALEGTIDDAAMREMNRAVDVDGAAPRDVARRFARRAF
ncbi:MAG: ABC transporter permease/substrate-binding protein [Sandaracinaceae bacterium]|nr:ABC transporter permease/substrate-binding protein [Sandaracinaceae bacterium]